MPQIQIAAESVRSLHVRGMRPPLGGGDLLELTQGTAFVLNHLGRFFLLTNLHIITGRDPVTDKPTGSAVLPSTLVVWHNSGNLGNWVQVNYELYDADGQAKWIENPGKNKWDIGAIEIAPQDGIDYHVYSFPEDDEVWTLSPGSDLSIVGFPFGTASDGRFAIWSRATVASDPDLQYLSRPAFLVDSRSRPGQSGSPVIHKANMSMVRNSVTGNMTMATGSQLIGIYSGRISPESDLGIVWKTAAIRGVIESYHRSERRGDD